MIETFKDMKHGKGGYESVKLERTASQLLHQMKETASEDSLDSTKARVLGELSFCCECFILTVSQQTLKRYTVPLAP